MFKSLCQKYFSMTVIFLHACLPAYVNFGQVWFPIPFSISFTATCKPFQRPLYTFPNCPFPMAFKSWMSFSSISTLARSSRKREKKEWLKYIFNLQNSLCNVVKMCRRHHNYLLCFLKAVNAWLCVTKFCVTVIIWFLWFTFDSLYG